MIKKGSLYQIWIYLLGATLLSLLLSFLYIFYPKLPDSIDNRLRDSLFALRGAIPHSNNIVIIDIDEKSLKSLGQWPWSRDKVAALLKKLSDNKVALIALDIVFAEEDNSSPHKVLQKLGLTHDSAPNYDLELAQTLAQTPTILGYLFELENKQHLSHEVANIPAIFIEKNKTMEQNYLIKAYGTILNIPLLQKSAYSSGFFNNIPDESGVIRSIPLLISYDDMLYPSLPLEVMRILTQTQKVSIHYQDQGVSSIELRDLHIPTDRYGRMLINFRGKEAHFPYYSAVDILNGSIEKEKLEGKIALVGTSADGLRDLRATPFESVFPGVEIHANVIDNMIQGDFIHKASWLDGVNIAAIFLLTFFIILAIKFTPFWCNPLLTLLLLGTFITGSYLLLFEYGYVINILFPLLAIVLGAIIATFLDYVYEIRQEEAIKKKFASKVSKEVMEDLLKNIHSNTFEVMEKEITVFFSDIRGFTNISEEMGDAKKLISYLNKYMDPMSTIITQYHGTIDKYIGDAIMAYWNAPLDTEDHADKALTTALMQLKALRKLNKDLKAQKLPPLDIGIGINTGMVVVGEMGSLQRSDYTVIGDTVNLGARLESLCKFYGSKINISEYTKARLRGEYIFRFLDRVRVKGKHKPVEIWEVLDFASKDSPLTQDLELYHKAIDLYQKSDFAQALAIFKTLEQDPKNVDQKIYTLYRQRSEEFLKNPPQNFDGVYEHLAKS